MRGTPATTTVRRSILGPQLGESKAKSHQENQLTPHPGVSLDAATVLLSCPGGKPNYLRDSGRDHAIIYGARILHPGAALLSGLPGSWHSIPDWNFPATRIVSLNVCPSLCGTSEDISGKSRESALAI